MDARRYDLDALRGFAMLLGIALHAGLSLTPFPWPVQDTRQSGAYGLVFAAVHGFRMPLFFLLSGFFTAMLWRKRGLKALLAHRLRRVFLPLLLGMVTIVPAVFAVSALAVASGLEAATKNPPEDAIWNAAASGDLDAIDRHLANGADPDGLDPAFGVSPLASAALSGRTEAVALLLERGAAIDGQNKDGSTALHSAAFLGRVEVAELLLERGARTDIVNSSDMVPAQSATVDWEITSYIIGLLRVEVDEEQVAAGRAAVIELLHAAQASPAESAAPGLSVGGLITSPWFTIPVFHHLWFLWFLCWLVAAFGLYALVAARLRWHHPPAWAVLSPARYLWLVPLTMVPQSFMGLVIPTFGPDTSIGLLPMPHILLYYAVFFGFGALYYDANDQSGRVGKGWRVGLPLGLLVFFPLGFDLATGGLGFSAGWFGEDAARLLGVALQAAYAWAMSFALMGLFRQYLGGERYAVRYLSDASYWLYVAHVPLVIAAQWLVRDWPLPTLAKFALICLAVTGFLLWVYQALVRYRWLGEFLNGPRARAAA